MAHRSNPICRPTPSRSPGSRTPQRCAGLVAGLLLAATGAAAAQAAPGSGTDAKAPTHALAVVGTLSSYADSTGTLLVPVPAGLTPRRLRGELSTTGPRDGDVTITVGGRTVLTTPAGDARPVAVRLRPDDVDAEGNLVVTLTHRPKVAEDDCVLVEPTRLTLEDLTLVSTGNEAAPRTVGDFLPALSSGVEVVVPTEAPDDVLEAALTAVSVAAARYGAQTPVGLVTETEVTGPGARAIEFRAGDTPVTTMIETGSGVPTLVVTGSGDELTAAARALGSPALGLADDDATEGLAATSGSVDRGLHHSLRTIARQESIVLSGYGTSTSFVGVRQDMFGGPIDELDLHLTGTHTAIPDGARVQLDLLFNGRVVASSRLADGTDFTLDATIRGEHLRSDNGLEVRFSGDPASGECATFGRYLPLEVHLDTADSTLTGHRGNGAVTGFARFPQVLGGDLPIALRGTGATRTALAADAARVVASLQRAADRPLRLDLIDPDRFIAGDRSGLLVGATTDDATALKAPLRLSEMRLMDYVENSFEVGTGQPFAALEAFGSDGRDVLLLGSWAPAGGEPSDLLHRATAHLVENSWGDLSDDVLVATGAGDPFTLSSNAVVPQQERADERRSNAGWFLGGLGVLVALVGVNMVIGRRRKAQVQRLVDAQERADSAERPETTDT